jgi:hypothetical protein
MFKAKPRITAEFVVGNRVQLAPHTDRWMRGDRFGTIVKVTHKLVHVKMDKSEHLAKLHPSRISEQF